MTTNLDLAALKKVAEACHTGSFSQTLAAIVDFRRTFDPPTVLALIELAGRRGVPDGWKLVPVEPTEAMLGASEAYACGQSKTDTVADWQAMLAAAPPPPIQGVEKDQGAAQDHALAASGEVEKHGKNCWDGIGFPCTCATDPSRAPGLHPDPVEGVREKVAMAVRRAINDTLSVHYNPVLGQGAGGLERRTAGRDKAINDATSTILALIPQAPRVDAGVVERVRKFVHEYTQMRGLHPDEIYGLHMGTQREASLTVSDLRAILAALTPETFATPPQLEGDV